MVARALRDAGMEVIYSGLRQTPEQVVSTAIQEDVDIVGLSILSGAHMTLIPEILKLLASRGGEDIIVVAGGILPEQDIHKLKELGLKAVFLPGTSTQTVVSTLEELAGKHAVAGA